MSSDLLERIHEIQDAISNLNLEDSQKSELRSHLLAIEAELRTTHPNREAIQARLLPLEEVVHEVVEIENIALEANVAKTKIFEWASSVAYALGFR